MVKKILIDHKGKKYFWNQGDLHTLYGVVKEKDILLGGDVMSHLGKKFLSFDAGFVDNILKLKKGPAFMTLKDIGVIISRIGICKESKIVEAGSGSGVLTSSLAQMSNHVTSYEYVQDHLNIAQKNLISLGLKAELKLQDIYQGIDEKNIDVLILDLAEPWKVLEHGVKALKSGGIFVSFVPQITQVIQLVEESLKFSYYFEECVENLERSWYVEGKKVRPHNQMLGHTGFLVFLRKI